MNKKIICSGIIAILFMCENGFGQNKDEELKELELKVIEAKQRVENASIFKLNDILRFLPNVTVARRAPYQEYYGPEETYVSASIQLNKLFDVTDIANKREKEKRKALKKIETIKFSIEKLIERKYLFNDIMTKFEKIVKSTDDVIEAAAKQEQIEKLKVQINEIQIEIKNKYFEMEEAVIEIEG